MPQASAGSLGGAAGGGGGDDALGRALSDLTDEVRSLRETMGGRQGDGQGGAAASGGAAQPAARPAPPLRSSRPAQTSTYDIARLLRLAGGGA